MYIPGPAINWSGTPRFVSRKLFAETSRIKRKPPRITGEDEDKPGFLCWGEVGDLPSAEPVPEVSFSVADYTETSRETEAVRIANPDDPEQYVDALQTKKIEMLEKRVDALEKNNTDTKDGDFSGIDEDLVNHFHNVISDLTGAKEVKTTFNYKPPERAL